MSRPRVIVALKEIEHVDSLVRLACEMTAGMDADLAAVHVVEVAAGLPLDADVEILDHPGKEVLRHARDTGMRLYRREIETRLLRAREAGRALVDEALDRRANLLVLGYSRKRGTDILERLLLGSTAEYVAKHTPCRMIVEVLPAARVAQEHEGMLAGKSVPVTSV